MKKQKLENPTPIEKPRAGIVPPLPPAEYILKPTRLSPHWGHVALPIYVQVDLGNGNTMFIGMHRLPGGGIFVGVHGWGALPLNEYITKEALNDIWDMPLEDAGNVADLLNVQMDTFTESQGTYETKYCI